VSFSASGSPIDAGGGHHRRVVEQRAAPVGERGHATDLAVARVLHDRGGQPARLLVGERC